MCAFIALICFVAKLLGGKLGGIDLVVLGFAFIAAHLFLSGWPFSGAAPFWRRRRPPA